MCPDQQPARTRSVTSRSYALIVILLVALALRTLFLLLTRDIRPVFDEGVYFNMAKEILANGDFQARWLWPPGQAYFMAGVFGIFGVNILAVKAVQVILSTLSVYLIYLVCRQTFGNERTALLAGAIAAIYPSLIAFSHYLWAETLFIFLLLCFVHLLLRSIDSRRYWPLAASGAFFALGCLTRPVLLPTFVIVLVYLWSRLRTRRRVLLLSIVVFAAAAGAVMTPWLVRTVHVYDGWVGIAPSAHHLWRGNSDLFQEAEDVDDFSREKYDAYGNRALERDRHALKKGIEKIRAEQPYWILKKGVIYLHTWAYDRSFPLRHMKLGLYRDMAPGTERLLVACFQFVYLAVMLAAILGFCWTAYRPEKWLWIGFLIVFSAVYILTISRNARLRLPLEAILIMFAAEGFLLPARHIRWHRGGSSPDRPAMVCLTVPPGTGKVLLRAALYCLFTVVFIYNCSVNVVTVARRLFP